MLDAERLLKAGYLALCHGDTKTSLTEKGSRPRRRRLVEHIFIFDHIKVIPQHLTCLNIAMFASRLHKMLRAKASAGTEKLVGTGLPLTTKPPSRRLVEQIVITYEKRTNPTICLLSPSVDESSSKEESVKSVESSRENGEDGDG